ncbi:MAG: phosphoribosylglycinamide formyltransferase, formyltetrahydrofolate-dependent [Actinomycetia bacterium]|nr:phosphoribosylglycinamide formyltransferase, formyltetrahydrofolate-dependent [Actinomycetes bacterium]
MRVGVLASGSGTILEAILAEGIEVAAVVVDRKCRAIEVARDAGVEAVLVERTDFSKTFDRDAYCDLVVAACRELDLDVLVSAGFGTVVPGVATAYAGRMINTHPALLPAFKGWHAVRDALERGVKVTGCTVHVVTEEVDEGPILAQEAVPVLPDDTEATLHERIKEVERRLLPATIRRFVEESS